MLVAELKTEGVELPSSELEPEKVYGRYQAPLDRTAAILITIFKSPKESIVPECPGETKHCQRRDLVVCGGFAFLTAAFQALTQHGCWQVKSACVAATASHSCLIFLV